MRKAQGGRSEEARSLPDADALHGHPGEGQGRPHRQEGFVIGARDADQEDVGRLNALQQARRASGRGDGTESRQVLQGEARRQATVVQETAALQIGGHQEQARGAGRATGSLHPEQASSSRLRPEARYTSRDMTDRSERPPARTFPIREAGTGVLLETLRERFGHAAFSGPQEEAIRAVLAGRDVLVTMPTGSGKSLIFQLPALLLEGLTLVISPLIALMKDQVDALQRRGLRATFVNSSLDAPERARRLGAARRGEFDLLFVTPERFRSPAFLEALEGFSVARLAVDEAHCISSWGHDFRPDYFLLGEYRALLGNPPTVALTATATPRVAQDIIGALGLEEPLVIRTGIERPNLFLATHTIGEAEEKVPYLARRIAEMDGAGIVYSTLIRDLERLHDELAARGIASLVYHGKLSPRERRDMQERFMAGEREVVLATNAFGMGVDKPDIRFVLHAQVPGTLEAWTQEVGRAGRDGAPSFCELLYFAEDVAVQQNFIEWRNPTREYVVGVYETLRSWGERLQAKDKDDLRAELLVKNRSDHRVDLALKWFEVLGVTEGSFETHDLRLVRPFDPGQLPGFVGSEDKRRADLEALLGLVALAREDGLCKRVHLARHFGLEEPGEPCGACSACSDPAQWIADKHAPRPLGARQTSADEAVQAGPWRRGMWVKVDGRHLGCIVGIDGEGSRVKLLIESAGDLRRRTIDPRAKRVEALEEGAL